MSGVILGSSDALAQCSASDPEASGGHGGAGEAGQAPRDTPAGFDWRRAGAVQVLAAIRLQKK